MRRGLRTRLKLNERGTVYWFEIQDPDAGNEDAFKSFGDELLDTERSLPKGVHVERVQEGQQTTPVRAIVFTPDGISKPYSILLQTGESMARTVEIGAWYDQVTVAIPAAQKQKAGTG